MATWRADNSMLTYKGVEILNKVKAGIGSITITRVVAGSGRVSESQLSVQTSISGVNKPMVLSQVFARDSGSEISIYITNDDFTESFPLNQIGVFVSHPDYAEEQLYHISQCDADGFDVIPVFNETPVSFGYSLYLEHGSSSSISITVNPQGMITRPEFDEYKVSVENRIANLKYSDVGAAPYEYVDTSITVVSAEDLDTKLDALLATMRSGKMKFVLVTFQERHPSLGGGNRIFRIDKINDKYCVIHSQGYTVDSDGVALEHVRSKSNGVWSSWARNYNTFYKPTLSELGAAPAGYGLGDKFTVRSTDVAILNTLVKSGWYSVEFGVATAIVTDYTGAYLQVRVDAYEPTQLIQTARFTNSIYTIQRTMIAGVWKPWEWVNPPMNTGVEYRTTERYQGVAVYKKVDANGNILWRKENETDWKTTSNSLVPATVE